MDRNLYEEMHARDDNGDGFKSIDVAMEYSPFPTGDHDREICFGRDDTDQENLLEVDDHVNDPSIYYTDDDFPPLPDFPCMSSSSSSSSAQVPTEAVASTSSSSSSSASSSSAPSCGVFNNPEHQESQFDHEVTAAAALSSTSSMGVYQPPDENDDCLNLMENFGYMDFLDSNDIWDPSSIFESENPPPPPPHEFRENKQEEKHLHQSQEGNERNDGLFFLQGNGELAAIFLEWLKQNKDYISAEDMRSIKLKRSTIECASKRLGSTKEGKKQLLKLILEWVEQYQLHKRSSRREMRATATSVADESLYKYQEQPASAAHNQSIIINPNQNSSSSIDLNCFSPNPSPWIPSPPPPCKSWTARFPPPNIGGYQTMTMSGNLYQPMDSPQSWSAPPFAMPAIHQYNPFPDNVSNPPVSGSHAYVNPPYPYQVFDGSSGGGERLVSLAGSSATKEARKKRMARQRSISMQQYRHHHHHHNQNHLHSQISTAVGDNPTCNSPSNNPAPGNWMYWSPDAAAPATAPLASTMPALVSPVETLPMQTTIQLVDHTHSQQPHNHHRQVPSDKKQSLKTENNLKFLLQKVLKQSDVGNLGRIVLPKKEAETHLPELESRDGIPIAMEDIGTSRVWNMRYRFWPNNKSRMYLLENTGDFVRVNGLQEGDFIVIYSDMKSGKYLIRGVKVRQPGPKSEGKNPVRRNQRNVVPQAAKH
ncbi:hypothetical protein ACH5RR_020358 [Cinchona calisaya]|uniref:TF-B3 domain-containing protein n=1 Tax=Cinchona calisaya TaxID=153742 RepID=A0ABD2ZE74_9GENT